MPATTPHVFPSLSLNGLKKTLNLSTDTLQVLLIGSGTYTWGAIPQTHKTVADFLAGDGTHGALTEVSTTGTGYTRQTLTSVTLTDSGLVTTLACADVLIPAATFTAVYALFFDNSVGGTDSTNQVLCYMDFGGAQGATAVTYKLTVPGGALITWTVS